MESGINILAVLERFTKSDMFQRDIVSLKRALIIFLLICVIYETTETFGLYNWIFFLV